MEHKKRALQIAALADEIIKIAEKIADSDKLHNRELKLVEIQKFNELLIDEFSEAELIVKAESIVKIRRRREKIFDQDGLFSDPCWDIILDLFSSHLKGKNISVTSACLAANTPVTTALRWMNVLEKSGLVERKKDPFDARRSFVQLTDNAIVKVTRVLEKYH